MPPQNMGYIMNSKAIVNIIILFLIILPCAAQDKMTMAILDLSASGVSEAEAAAISNRIRNELFLTGNYTVLEREAMEEVLSEQGLQMSGCTTSDCIIEAGKMLGVQRMVAGSLDKLGQLYTIHLRMIDVQSGEILAVASSDCLCPIEEVAVKSTKDAVSKLTSEHGTTLQQMESMLGQDDEYAEKPTSSEPKLRFGIKFGVNIGSIDDPGLETLLTYPNSADLTSTPVVDGMWELSVIYRISRKFTLQSGISLAAWQKKYEWDTGSGIYKGFARLMVVKLPVLARFHTPWKRVSGFAGIALVFLGDDHIEYDYLNGFWEGHLIEDWGGARGQVILGADYEIPLWKGMLVVDLQIVLGDGPEMQFPYSPDVLAADPSLEPLTSDLSLNAFIFGIGYYFTLK